MDRLTRKQLKSDKFALEVQHSVEYISEHRRLMTQGGAIAAAVVLIVGGIYLYRNHQQTVREEALHNAMLIQNSTVGASPSQYVVSFPTAQARKTAVLKAWQDLAAKYPGTDESEIADYFLGTNAADDGNLPEAVKHFQAAINNGEGPYASEAKLSLAQVYAGEGKVNEGAKLIQSIIDHPTVLVSKDEATLVLANLIENSDPKRAKKLIEPLRTSTRSAVSKAAITLDASLSQR